MVWSQYVYEATAYNDVVGGSDDDECNDDTPLNIEDWEVQYSDELRYMWNMIDTLTYDAQMNHSGKFCDFVEFCSTEHTDDCDFVWLPYEAQLSYIWRHIQEFLEDTGLYNEFMPGATFDHWVRFAFYHTKQNNVRIY